MSAPETVLDFWFDDQTKARWFNSTDAFDADIRARFLDTAEALSTDAAMRSDWQKTADGSLALIIALDQFPRNMFRGQARAFAWDPISLAAAKQMVSRGQDMDISKARRAFVYMPYMHSENLADQQRCVSLSSERLDDQSTAKHARQHMELIALFGRFPHRNPVLGRDSTPAETDFLQNGGYDPS